MKLSFSVALFFIVTFGCNVKNAKPVISTNDNTLSNGNDTASNFFPVTSFLKGEIRNIKLGSFTPFLKTTIGNSTDSALLKIEEIDDVVAPFLNPIIDSINCKNFFIEKTFLDQTINAITFTYDSKPSSFVNFAFIHWDIYIDPDTEKVTRIYLVKKESENKIVQLTWIVGKYCTIVSINNKTTEVEKVVKLSWSYK